MAMEQWSSQLAKNKVTNDIHWIPTACSWITLNTDGAHKSESGYARCNTISFYFL
jgi:hypothetical protein